MAATPTRAVKAPLTTPSPNRRDSFDSKPPPATEWIRSSPTASAPVAARWVRTVRTSRHDPNVPDRPPYISAIRRIMPRLATSAVTTSAKASGTKAVTSATRRAACSTAATAARSALASTSVSAKPIRPSASNRSPLRASSRARPACISGLASYKACTRPTTSRAAARSPAAAAASAASRMASSRRSRAKADISRNPIKAEASRNSASSPSATPPSRLLRAKSPVTKSQAKSDRTNPASPVNVAQKNRPRPFVRATKASRCIAAPPAPSPSGTGGAVAGVRAASPSSSIRTAALRGSAIAPPQSLTAGRQTETPPRGPA